MDGVFVLIHSPLVGPLTWSRVAKHLRQRDREAVVPAVLGDDERAQVAYWQQEVEAIRSQLTSVPRDRPVILVGHSGAGALLPAIGKMMPQQVMSYVFVDAGLPHPGQTRLEEIRALDFFEEPLPVVEGWPDAPCSYIQLSPGYSSAAEAAGHAGWPVKIFEAGHFHMLVDPAGVTEALLAI